MAITGISALSGQQIIASGACSARSAATASYTTGGNDLQGLYTTVNTNSASWTGGGSVILATGQGARQDSAGLVSTAETITAIDNDVLMASYLYSAGVVQRNPGAYQLDISPSQTMFTTNDRSGVFSPLQYATGAGLMMSAGNFKGYAKANETFVSDNRYGYARVESHGTRGNRIVVQSTGLASAQMSARGNTAQITLGTTNGTAYIDVTKINQWDSAYSQLGNVTALLDSL